MHKILGAGLAAALFTGPIVLPIAWGQMLAEPARPALALPYGGLVVHGVAINPQLLPSGSMVLVDGVTMNPQLATR